MRVVILVPRRDDKGWRDRLWKHCKAIWETQFPEWLIFEGHHDVAEGPFNRSLAINRAAALAGEWDVALVIDSDTISEPEAVRKAVQYAWETGDLSIAHNARLMLSRKATDSILTGVNPQTLNNRRNVRKTYYDSISCAVAVRRNEWDIVGGFDTRFEGWGFEDTAFRIAVETLTNRPIHIEKANCFHLWHEPSPEASQYAPTFAKNTALKLLYTRAHFQPERLKAILKGEPDPGAVYGIIPKVIHRTVPAETTEEVEAWWAQFQVLHPDWELKTWRDPLDPQDFPLTYYLHDKCANGAQKAGLIRLELLVTHGGIYVDSDVEPIRPMDALLHLPAFAAWEDEKVVPDAVLGATPNHPAFCEMLQKAIALVEGGSIDAWETGPGVATSILPWRDDVLLLPPGSFYPIHYKEKQFVGSKNGRPWVFLEHKWHHSWSEKKTRTSASSSSINKRATVGFPVQNIELPESLTFAICMPWSASKDQWRQESHDWCVAYWESAGFSVIEGGGTSRAAMCNAAAQEALDKEVDILVFADADTWAPAIQVINGVNLAHEKEQAVHCFTKYVKLDAGQSRQGLRTNPIRLRPQMLSRAGKTRENHVSGLTAVPALLWNQIGGFDERFIGWGFEDQAFHLAAEVLGGAVQRVEGHAFHWYHRNDPTKRSVPNPEDPKLKLIEKYCQAAGRIPEYGRVGRLSTIGFIEIEEAAPSAKKMQSLLSEEGGPLSPLTVVL